MRFEFHSKALSRNVVLKLWRPHAISCTRESQKHHCATCYKPSRLTWMPNKGIFFCSVVCYTHVVFRQCRVLWLAVELCRADRGARGLNGSAMLIQSY